MASKIFSLSSKTTLVTFSIAIFLVFISIVDVASGASVGNRRFTKIYAFGDSYTDTGNTRSETGPSGFQHVSQPPYGMTYFHRPTNRYSDGRLVIDFVAEALSLPHLPPSSSNGRITDTSHGINFAVAGSTAIEYDFFVKNNATLDIIHDSIATQMASFNKFLGSHGCRPRGASRSNFKMSQQCSVLLDDALFWVGEIGANDYAYAIGSSIPSSTIQKLAVNRVTSALQELLEMGAKYVIVQGLPTTGCLPLALTLAATEDRDEIGCVGSANKQSYAHNTQLQANIEALRKKHPRAMISYLDYWNAYRTVMKSPTKYGFKEPFKACCGYGGGPYNFDLLTFCGSTEVSKACVNPSQYINWDGVHLTEAMYKVMADLFMHGGMSHPSFDVLLSSKSRGG